MAAPGAAWLSIDRSALPSSGLLAIDPGERHVILLGLRCSAELNLMDDRAGVAAARASGLAVVGTLGLIQQAGQRGLIGVADVIERLRGTSFRCDEVLLQGVIDNSHN